MAREGRLLVGLRCLPLGDLAATIPRYVRSADWGGLPVLVSSVAAGHADERGVPRVAAHGAP